MAPRLQLHEVLEGLAGHVYFQPPTNVQMSYPCIVYERNGGESDYADNSRYSLTKRYQVTVIDKDPDSALSDAVEELPMCDFDRFFAAGQLNHFVFNLFF